jgi:hypothetical protein
MEFLKNKLQILTTNKFLLDLLYILFLIAICRNFIIEMFNDFGLGSYNISEFLINYQGGFVRRGLLGEILFQTRTIVPFDVKWTVKIFCAICFFLICFFFIYQFRRRKYSLYILPLCFFCGAIDWIRKDTLMLAFLIALLWIFQNPAKLPIAIKILLINILLSFIILCHEVVAFFSIPIFLLLFINYFKSKGIFKSLIMSILFLCPTIITFLLTITAKGNLEIAQTIWDSWHILLKQELSSVEYNNSIGALFWDTKATLKSHFSELFFTIDWGMLSLFVWIITFHIIYYITVNFLFVFKNKNSTFNAEKRTILSAIFIFQFICLLPLFLGLSKDYIRLFFYLTASTFAIFLLIPFDTLKSLFPNFYLRFVEKLNKRFNNLILPTKTVLIMLMFVVGISDYGFSIYQTVNNSMLAQIINILTIAVKPIIELIKTFLWTL